MLFYLNYTPVFCFFLKTVESRGTKLSEISIPEFSSPHLSLKLYRTEAQMCVFCPSLFSIQCDVQCRRPADCFPLKLNKSSIPFLITLLFPFIRLRWEYAFINMAFSIIQNKLIVLYKIMQVSLSLNHFSTNYLIFKHLQRTGFSPRIWVILN